jgi:DNA repair exonuclease SbcCD ATPase subunit
MKVLIKKMKFVNFKKFTQFEIEFDDQLTNIYGANASGKTSILDGFNWLLFGKNSESKSDFNFKPLDNEMNVIPRLETEVEAVIVINGNEFSLKRINREKWTKKRNSVKEEFTGNTEEFFINDVPKSKSEYQSFVAEYFQGEEFRMVTDVKYFNEVMKWEKRREILISKLGNVSYSSVLSDKFPFIQELYSKSDDEKFGIVLEDQKKTIKSKITKCVESMETTPARIDELKRQIKELTPLDKLEQRKTEINTEIDRLNALINSEFLALEEKNKSIREAQERKNKLKFDIQAAQSELARKHQLKVNEQRASIDNLKWELNQKQAELSRIENAINTHDATIERLTTQITNFRIDYKKQEELTFNEDLKCNSCGQNLPSDNVAQLNTTFNQNKVNTMNSIVKQANDLKAQIEAEQKAKFEQEKMITPIKESIEKLKTSISLHESQPIEQAPTTSQEIDVMLFEYNAINIDEIEQPNNEETKLKINDLKQQLDAIQVEISNHTVNKSLNDRIIELNNQQKATIQELDELENKDYQIRMFINEFIAKVEDSINTHFSFVKFKMFEMQVNGELRAICTATVNGVPYQDVNTAGKINASLDVIKTLQSCFSINAPIFIDNRESVSDIIPMQSQIINLIVKAGASLSIQ